MHFAGICLLHLSLFLSSNDAFVVEKASVRLRRGRLLLLAVGAHTKSDAHAHHHKDDVPSSSHKQFPDIGSSSSSSSSSSDHGVVTFWGHGSDAIVRVGSVLVAPLYEFHHYYRRAAIFIFAMGNTGDNNYVIRGVILDHPTPFHLGELLEESVSSSSIMATQPVFRGGPNGGNGVILFHNRGEFDNCEEIGNSKLYQGGWNQAMEAVAKGTAQAADFKVFFNYCEFTEQELEDLFDATEGGDEWMSVTVDPELVLKDYQARGDAWARLRNAVTQMQLEADVTQMQLESDVDRPSEGG